MSLALQEADADLRAALEREFPRATIEADEWVEPLPDAEASLTDSRGETATAKTNKHGVAKFNVITGEQTAAKRKQMNDPIKAVKPMP